MQYNRDLKMINIRELKSDEQQAVRQIRNNYKFVTYLEESADQLVAHLLKEDSVAKIHRLQGRILAINELLEAIKSELKG